MHRDQKNEFISFLTEPHVGFADIMAAPPEAANRLVPREFLDRPASLRTTFFRPQGRSWICVVFAWAARTYCDFSAQERGMVQTQVTSAAEGDSAASDCTRCTAFPQLLVSQQVNSEKSCVEMRAPLPPACRRTATCSDRVLNHAKNDPGRGVPYPGSFLG
jgi:hypothetical protein